MPPQFELDPSPHEGREIWVPVIMGVLACVAVAGVLFAWWYFRLGA